MEVQGHRVFQGFAVVFCEHKLYCQLYIPLLGAGFCLAAMKQTVKKQQLYILQLTKPLESQTLMQFS